VTTVKPIDPMTSLIAQRNTRESVSHAQPSSKEGDEVVHTCNTLTLMFVSIRLLRLIFEDHKRSLENYPLSSVSSLEKTKIISFAYTHWKFDDRLYNERIENPSAKIIDVGFAGANIHDLKPLESKAKHYNNIQNSRLFQGGNAKKVVSLEGASVCLTFNMCSPDFRPCYHARC
jgi:hypothetical protein